MRKKTRVLCVTKSTGGLASYNWNLCKGIDREQFELAVLCLSENNEEYAQRIRGLGIDAFTLDMDRYRINPITDLQVFTEIYKIVKEGNYDVLLAHGSKAGFIMRVIGRLTSVPAIYCLASMSFVSRIQGKKAYLYRLLEYLASFSGGHIVTLSKSTRNELIRLHLSDDSHTSIIYTGIDLEKFQPNKYTREEACAALGLDPSRLVCGWAARFTPQKDPLAFVQIMAKVVEQFPSVQIFMAGEGALKQQVQSLARELNLTNNIIFAPWQKDVPLMLSAFDVYVLNSRWEGLPLSLLEAMAMECASVATAIDGNVEVIENGVSGFLAELDDHEALVDHIVTLLRDQQLREKMGQEARKRIQDAFAIQRMVKDWEVLLLEQQKN